MPKVIEMLSFMEVARLCLGGREVVFTGGKCEANDCMPLYIFADHKTQQIGIVLATPEAPPKIAETRSESERIDELAKKKEDIPDSSNTEAEAAPEVKGEEAPADPGK